MIPKAINGRGKAFFFANYSQSNDSAPGRLAGNSTVPANRKHFPIYMLASMFLGGAVCWLLIDPHKPVFEDEAA